MCLPFLRALTYYVMLMAYGATLLREHNLETYLTRKRLSRAVPILRTTAVLARIHSTYLQLAVSFKKDNQQARYPPEHRMVTMAAIQVIFC